MKEVVATIAGLVIEVKMEIGQEVEAGQVIATLESMKMEIPLKSLESGIVSEIKIEEGDFVDEGQAVVILE